MTTLEQNSFGHWLRLKRKALDLTQDGLADRVGCSAATIRKLEAEERRPSAPIVERLAEIFNIIPDQHTAFLRFARGDWHAAPRDILREPPWAGSNRVSLSNLPHTTTTLIGRDQEIQLVRGYLLNPDIRLVTLIGPPGIGKTRLSVAAAREALSYFRNGVFFVALAPLDQADLVAPTLIHTLGSIETNRPSALALLKDSIGDKRMLLVLDNVEHLIEGTAPLVAELLSVCPQLKIMTTSRESLRVPGEWLYPVPALSIPTTSQLRSLALEEAAHFAAVQLFIERARAAGSDFRLNTDNLRTIAAICAGLDGLPLAIELIAGRLRSMGLLALLERLNTQFVLAADGVRAVPARQKTLQGAIGWSYDLLSNEEQRFFACLSVFSGGFTLEAAASVFSGMFTAQPVSDRIVSLFDKSLLQRVSGGATNAETRFTLLETIRAYALARLREAGELDELRQRHRAYYFQLLRQGDARANRREGVVWLNRVETELENMRAALTYCLDAEAADEALDALEFLQWLWVRRGHPREGAEWYKRVLPRARTNSPRYAQGLVHAAELALMLGDLEQANSLLTRALESARANDNQWLLQNALGGLGILTMEQGNLPLAREYFQEARRILLEFYPDRPDSGYVYHLAKIEMQIGDLTSARLLWEAGLKLAEQMGSDFLRGWGLGGLSMLALREHRFEAATRLSQDSLKLKIESQDRVGIFYTLETLAMIASKQAQVRRAATLWGAAEQLRETWHAAVDTTLHNELEIGMADARSQLDAVTFANAWAEGRAMTLEQAIEYASSNKTDLYFPHNRPS